MILALLLVLGLVWGCVPRAGPRPESRLAENLDYLVKQGTKSWGRRVDPRDARRSRLFLDQASRLDPANLELAALHARACHFVGYYLEDDPARQDSFYWEGASAAWRALQRSAIFRAAFQEAQGDSSAREVAALAATLPEQIPLLYWWAANLSHYLATKPVRQRLDHREAVETALHRILALEPNFFHGGPYRIFGSFYAKTPGVELSRSREYFQKAIQANPHYLGTYVLRARYYHTKAGNRELFHRDLTTVIQADPTVIPDVMPENLLEQEQARRLLQQEALLFE